MNATVHVWHRCHACGAAPIIGARYECRTCRAGPDNDLCASCYASWRGGHVAHPAPDTYAEHLSAGRHEFYEVAGVPSDTFERWREIRDDKAAPPPAVPDHVVVRPEFHSGRMSSIGSFAFAIQADAPGPPLVATALHLLDEIAKRAAIDCSPRNSAYTGEELPSIVDHVTLYDVFATRWMFSPLGTARPMLVLPDARTGEEEPYCRRDVALFVADEETALETLPLAASAPAAGEPVWIAAGTASNRTVRGLVVESSPEALVFRLAPDAAVPRYTSGSPLLNRRGAVVGINVGSGVLDTFRYGHAVHVTNIRRHLRGSWAWSELRSS